MRRACGAIETKAPEAAPAEPSGPVVEVKPAPAVKTAIPKGKE